MYVSTKHMCRANSYVPREPICAYCSSAPVYICAPAVEGLSHLLYDMSVLCDGSSYYTHLAFASLLLLLLVVGMPCGIVRLGHPSHRQLQNSPGFQFLFGGWLHYVTM